MCKYLIDKNYNQFIIHNKVQIYSSISKSFKFVVNYTYNQNFKLRYCKIKCQLQHVQLNFNKIVKSKLLYYLCNDINVNVITLMVYKFGLETYNKYSGFAYLLHTLHRLIYTENPLENLLFSLTWLNIFQALNITFLLTATTKYTSWKNNNITKSTCVKLNVFEYTLMCVKIILRNTFSSKQFSNLCKTNQSNI